jgi:hypothetical protein
LLSLQQIGTICLSFFLILISQSSYSDIAAGANSASCDNSTLNTYTGPAALEAKWNANEIQLRWYDNNTLMSVTSTESTCDYDDDITVPTAPSRTGYDFAGWTIRQQRDFSTLNASLSATCSKRWGKGEHYTQHTDYCYYKEGDGNAINLACNSDANFFELKQHEWKVEFPQGDVYGMAKCSATSGTYSVAGTPSDEGTRDTKQYCWCKATGWKPNGSNTLQSPLASLSWVFNLDRGSASGCSADCAAHCSYRVRGNSGFRAALFAPATSGQ